MAIKKSINVDFEIDIFIKLNFNEISPLCFLNLKIISSKYNKMISKNKIIEYNSIEFKLTKSKNRTDDPMNAIDSKGYKVIFIKMLLDLNLSDKRSVSKKILYIQLPGKNIKPSVKQMPLIRFKNFICSQIINTLENGKGGINSDNNMDNKINIFIESSERNRN